MAGEKIKLPIRSALIPVFYQKFHCLMGGCQDNCCDGSWKIEFSKKDYLTVKRVTEKSRELHQLVSQGMRRLREREHDGLYAEFCFTDTGRCAFHAEDGLCQLQLECGEGALPHVCRVYPRKIMYSPAAREYTLSPSCEGVLQQLWDLPEGVEFVEDPLPKTEWGNSVIKKDENLWLWFAPVRGLFIDILQNRAMPLSERILYLGVVIQRLQKADWASFEPDSWIERVVLQTDVATIEEMAANVDGNRDMYILQNLKVLNAIYTEEKRWPAEIYNALEAKYKRESTITVKLGGESEKKTLITTTGYSKEAYEDALAQFREGFSDYEYFFENLMVSAALYLDFPSLDSREALWKSYVSLCNLYSFYRFVSVLGCKEDATKERLFHMIVMASRATLHNRDRFNGFQEELFQHDSSTLAHMAILLNG